MPNKLVRLVTCSKFFFPLVKTTVMVYYWYTGNKIKLFVNLDKLVRLNSIDPVMFIPHYGCASKEIISYFSLLLFIFLIYVEWGGREERKEGLGKERKRGHEEGGREKEREKWGEKQFCSVFMHCLLSDS